MNELLKRADHGAIVLMHAIDGKNVAIRRRWRGNTHTVAGLLLDAANWVCIQFASGSTDGLPNELKDTGESHNSEGDDDDGLQCPPDKE